MPTVTETVVLTSGTTWTVPYTWNNLNNSITCIGGGAGGGYLVSTGGGGGGSRSISTNISLTAGTNLTYLIGGGGSSAAAGGDTWIRTDGGSTAVTSSIQGILAKGGSSTTTGTGGIGGSTSSSFGTIKTAGGDGGVGDSYVGGGGGGAGGDLSGGISGSFGISGTGTGGSGGRGGGSGALDTTCRYVRWNIASTKTYGWALQASEFKLTTYGGSPVSISSVTATYGNSETSDPGQASYPPSNLIDGSTSTKFASSNNYGPWLITFDLGSQKTFAYYYWVTAPDLAQTDAYNWSLEVSDDGINWTTINYYSNYAGTTSRAYQLGPFANAIFGGEGGLGGVGAAGLAGKEGFPVGTGLNNAYIYQYGLNYAGGGGGGGGSVSNKAGTTGYTGASGAAFGGGGGGNGVTNPGAQGGIIINWTYTSVLPSAGQQVSMSDIAGVLGTSTNISLGNTAVRTAFGVSSGAISFSNGANKYKIPTVVTYINTAGATSGSISLLSGGSNYGGWQSDDLALAFVQETYNSPVQQLNSLEWKFLGYVFSPHNYYLSVFSRVLDNGDSVFNYTAGIGGGSIVILRGASSARVRRVASIYNATTNPTPLSFTGITKSSSAKSLLSFICSRYPSDSGITIPSGWTESSAASWTYFYAKSAIINASSYTNGSAITWTGIAYTGYYTTGLLLEIT